GAGLNAPGLDGEAPAIRTPASELGERLHELAAAGYRGVNLTHPLKQAVLDHLGRASEPARRALSVNTVGFDSGLTWGDTTDGAGFVEMLRAREWAPLAQRCVVLSDWG